MLWSLDFPMVIERSLHEGRHLKGEAHGLFGGERVESDVCVVVPDSYLVATGIQRLKQLQRKWHDTVFLIKLLQDANLSFVIINSAREILEEKDLSLAIYRIYELEKINAEWLTLNAVYVTMKILLGFMHVCLEVNLAHQNQIEEKRNPDKIITKLGVSQ